jgi:lysophospholipase L1-like esterase
VLSADTTPVKLATTDRLLFFGDSITEFGGDHAAGYVNLVKAALESLLPGITVFEAGISGNTVQDLQARVKRDVLAKTPSVVVIYIGTNDVWRQMEGGGVEADSFRSDLFSLIEQLEKHGARVLLCTPAVIGEAKRNTLDALLDQYSEIIRKFGAERQIQVIDLRLAFRQYLAVHNSIDVEQGILTGDGVHLNDLGDRLVADQILKALIPG